MIEYAVMICMSLMVAVMSVSSLTIAKKNKNAILGYRTKKSMASEQAWETANHWFGIYTGILTVIMLGISLLTVTNYTVNIMWIQLAVLLIGLALCVVLVEKKIGTGKND